MYPEEQNRKRNDRDKQISRPSLKSALASAVFIGGHWRFITRLFYLPMRLCHNIMTSVYMLLPCSSMSAFCGRSSSAWNRSARPISAYLRLTHPFFARSLTWASSSRASVGREGPVSLLAILTVLHVEILLAWLNRVLPFDSYRYAFIAE